MFAFIPAIFMFATSAPVATADDELHRAVFPASPRPGRTSLILAQEEQELGTFVAVAAQLQSFGDSTTYDQRLFEAVFISTFGDTMVVQNRLRLPATPTGTQTIADVRGSVRRWASRTSPPDSIVVIDLRETHSASAWAVALRRPAVVATWAPRTYEPRMIDIDGGFTYEIALVAPGGDAPMRLLRWERDRYVDSPADTSKARRRLAEAALLVSKAEALLDDRDFDHAEALAAKTLDAWGENRRAMIIRCRALSALGRLEEARDAARSARDAWPDRPETWLAYADAVFAMGVYERARELYERYLVFPDAPAADSVRVLIKRIGGRW